MNTDMKQEENVTPRVATHTIPLCSSVSPVLNGFLIHVNPCKSVAQRI